MTKIQANSSKCVNCGGNLVFSPSLQSLYCLSCGSTDNIDVKIFDNKRDYSDSSSSVYVHGKKGYIKCPNCGSSVETDGNDLSVRCNYCETPLALDTEGLLSAPDFIIPFKLDKEQVAEKFISGVKKKFFLPNKFKKKPPLESIEGFYFPAFCFDEKTFTTYRGKLGKNHTRRNAEGHFETYTTYKSISGTKSLSHRNVFIETSSDLTQSELAYILPYDTRHLYCYDEKFVMGFSLEKIASTLKECKESADITIDGIIRTTILSEYSYDSVVSFSADTTRSDVKFAYGALPVYKVSYTYKNKKYNTLINGQTGEIGGGLPKSVAKITLLVIFLLLIFIGLPLLIMLFS